MIIDLVYQSIDPQPRTLRLRIGTFHRCKVQHRLMDWGVFLGLHRYCPLKPPLNLQLLQCICFESRVGPYRWSFPGHARLRLTVC